MRDLRTINSGNYKGEQWTYRKIRILTTQPQYGITIPKKVAENFLGEKFTCEFNENQIILTRSGCQQTEDVEVVT